jgi:hypothetical protein
MTRLSFPIQETDTMPSFQTPGPITASIDVQLGDVRISAGERDVTIVRVEPSDPGRDDDRRIAERTRVELASQQLLVKAPRQRNPLARRGGSIDVTIELPAGSNVEGSGGMTDFCCDGPLGDCRIKTGVGEIQVESADRPRLRSGVGDIGIDRAAGHAELNVGSGEVRARELDATAVIRNSNGDTWVGAAAGELRLSSANGSIAIDAARSGVVAKSSNGDVRLGEVGRGTVVLETKIGDVEIGIPEGTAAWLDLRSTVGKVRNELTAAEAPDEPSEGVEVRARTTTGSVIVRRP